MNSSFCIKPQKIVTIENIIQRKFEVRLYSKNIHYVTLPVFNATGFRHYTKQDNTYDVCRNILIIKKHIKEIETKTY